MGNYRKLIVQPTFIGFNLCAAAAVTINIVYTTISPFLFQISYNLTPIQYGWLGVAFGVSGIIGKYISAISLKHLGSFRSILLGLCIFLMSGIMLLTMTLFQFTKIWQVTIAIAFCTTGQGFVVSNAMTLALNKFKKIGGAASAMYSTINFLLGFLTSTVLSLTHNFDVTVLGCSYISLALIGFISYRIAQRHQDLL